MSKKCVVYKMLEWLEVSFHFDSAEYPILHTHEYFEIVITNHGSITHEVDGKNYIVNKNQAILLDPKCEHRTKNNNGVYDALNITITPKAFKRVCSAVGDTTYETIKESLPYCFSFNELAGMQIRELINQAQQYDLSDEKRRLVLMYVTFLLVSEIVRTKFIEMDSVDKLQFGKVVECFFDQLQDRRNIGKSLAEICAKIPYHQSHILRVFKQKGLDTPNNILLNHKLSFAASLLVSTDMRVIDICNEIGYDSIAYFNKVFKKKYSCTPKEYRKNHSPGG